jgi:aspartate racemase
MARAIGIVAESAEGAALCYQTICREAPLAMGDYAHPEILMHNYPLSQYMALFEAGDWQGVARMLLTSVGKLAQGGADFAIMPCNTLHQALPDVMRESPIPWIHIAEPIAEEARRKNHRCLGILGTSYLMDGPVYRDILDPLDLAWQVPDPEDRKRVDEIIFDELVNNIFKEESRLTFNAVMQRMKQAGCDAVVLGCTEIPLLVDPDDTPLPVLDSTRLLARAALQRAIQAD